MTPPPPLLLLLDLRTPDGLKTTVPPSSPRPAPPPRPPSQLKRLNSPTNQIDSGRSGLGIVGGASAKWEASTAGVNEEAWPGAYATPSTFYPSSPYPPLLHLVWEKGHSPFFFFFLFFLFYFIFFNFFFSFCCLFQIISELDDVCKGSIFPLL